MKRIKLKYLRTLLFLFLAVLFAGLAIIEAIPQKPRGDFIQEREFTVSSQKQEDGTYLYSVFGTVRNVSSQTQLLTGVMVHVRDQENAEVLIEIELNQSVAPNGICEVAGTELSMKPAADVIKVSTSALSGDDPIELPQTGLQITKGFVIFIILSALCLIVALVFLIYRLTHRRHHHHHSKKSA